MSKFITTSTSVRTDDPMATLDRRILGILKSDLTYKITKGVLLATYSDRLVDPHCLNASERARHVVVGMGITSTNYHNPNPKDLIFFTIFLKTFCISISASNRIFHMYLAYDYNDALFTSTRFRKSFIERYSDLKKDLCPDKEITLTLLRCPHNKKPAWAQNDAMMEAYLDGFDYFYRVNDDTSLSTSRWDDIFIKELSLFNPPNVGVVGPKHSGGNENILTYDFVHRMHIDIFGYYYPRTFTDWYADKWITTVYRPKNCKKLSNVRVIHLLVKMRYLPRMSLKSDAKLLLKTPILTKHLSNARKSFSEIKKSSVNKVICMTLDQNSAPIIMGAIRNALLTPLTFPGWKLRIYAMFQDNDRLNRGQRNDHPIKIPFRIKRCLERLGAEIVEVDKFFPQIVIMEKSELKHPSFMWSYLVIDDQKVDYFIIRKPEFRLSSRDYLLVNDFFMKSENRFNRNSTHLSKGKPLLAFHSIIDSEYFQNFTLVPGLLSGNVKVIRHLLGSSGNFIQTVLNHTNENDDEYKFLNFLYGKFKQNFYRHDPSTSCVHCDSKEPRNLYNILGLKYNQFHIPQDVSWFSIR
ncbi:hypothetical protein HELRODRAFT_167195 [Helobdella robusta]|uniref:Uncharacterized protein n=1 Tax=Helobdella robusta TaxID=6412 RepID=T1EZ47_HELRO|nr:hypothetical protein HELRODRAFT_167195 [Helobdella robusta]ESO10703.1 hypothetical protein HELRODRAFT_167195 [Helobdella robusta]